MTRPLGRISMMWRGQALAHAPHDVHFVSSTSGSPVDGLMAMAPKEHAATQSPQPRHPNPQPVSPDPVAFTAVHVRSPSYSIVRGRFSKHPAQRTTATLGSEAATAMPRRSATFAMHSCPPTGQSNPSIEPALAPLMRASAMPEHPG